MRTEKLLKNLEMLLNQSHSMRVVSDSYRQAMVALFEREIQHVMEDAKGDILRAIGYQDDDDIVTDDIDPVEGGCWVVQRVWHSTTEVVDALYTIDEEAEDDCEHLGAGSDWSCGTFSG